MSARLSDRLSLVAERVRRVCTRVLGAPDYEAYVAHVRAVHAGCAPLSREEFERQSLNDRYSRPGARCC